MHLLFLVSAFIYDIFISYICIPKDDSKQKCIDSFFNRVTKTPQRTLTEQQDPAAAIADEAKATKPEKEG